MKPVVLDVDEVRTEIFGGMKGTPDSPESMRYHIWTMEALFNCLVPSVITSGGVPIMVAGHSRKDQFDRAVEISSQLGTDLRFLIVEAPTLEEAMRRATEVSPDDHTDMCDFSDLKIRDAFQAAVRRVENLYAGIHDPRVHRIPQGRPETMTQVALDALV